MYVDFAIIDTDITDRKAKEIIAEAISYKIDSITVPYHLLKLCKNKKNVLISCLIDFPMGISDPATRVFSVEKAIDAGANCIDIVMPQNLAANRRYDKIREDIQNLKKLAENIRIRYILEYRVFDHKCLKKICQIFDENEITFVAPSTGFFIDNLADNLIASAFLHENSKEINVLATGNAWTDRHFNILNKSGVFGFRAYNIECLRRYSKFIS